MHKTSRRWHNVNVAGWQNEVTAVLVKLLGFLLYANVMFTVILYVYLKNKSKLYSMKDGGNIATIAGGFLALSCGVILIYQFPFHFVVVTIISTLIGMAAGASFGALFHNEALLTGYSHGMMLGVMAPMIGAAAKNSLVFLLFLEICFLFSFVFVYRFPKS